MSKKAKPGAGTIGVPKKKEKKDEAIIGTNDYSIVSKRSVEKLYLQDEPQFFRPFIEKPKRRAPLINRGYWLRMQAIEHVVKSFLEESSSKDKIIVNLGCGYEPLPFRMLWRYKDQCQNVKFIDIDFPQLIRRKVGIICKHGMYTDLLQDFTERNNSPEPVLIDHKRYSAIGCDLGDAAAMRDLFLTLQLTTHAVLFLAEVSMVYMEPVEATTLIKICGELPDARFGMLEQHLPAGLDHPFAKTMIDHFNKQTPLRALASYPTIESQRTRFQACGWPEVGIQNLWYLWQYNKLFGNDSKSRLDIVEPFDEWEELALFAGHYFLLSATTFTASKQKFPNTSKNIQNVERSLADFQLLASENSACTGQRRFGAIIDIDDQSFAHHGGIVSTKVQTGYDLYTKNGRAVNVVEPPEHLICHTLTTLHDGTVLFAGGRKSPASPSAACYLRENHTWTRTHELRPARYRHCSVAVTIDSKPSVLVCGGQSGNGSALALWQLYDRELGWRELPCDINIEVFGAAMVATSKTSGVLVGGMSSSGTLLSQYIEWRLIQNGEEGVKLECEQMWDSRSSICRFGACLVRHPCGLILIGGIGTDGVLEADQEIMVITPDGNVKNTKSISALLSTGGSRPMLTGHSVKVIGDDVIIVGGGGVCFSFGAFWNKHQLILRPSEADNKSAWQLLLPKSNILQNAAGKDVPNLHADLNESSDVQEPQKIQSSALHRAKRVPCIDLSSSEDFTALVTKAQPVVLQNLDLGPCLTLWTPEYLKEKTGPDRAVIIHASKEPHLSFLTKNFTYETRPFSQFIDAAMNGQHVYLRALSSANPSKIPAALHRDFPSIAGDFVIPDILEMARENEHSSVLRISGATTMWLHYDVMVNILCQIRGSKKVVLFPPSDIRYLEFVHGETTSGLNVFTTPPEKLEKTHLVETVLEEGKVLFIPACWAHATAPAGEKGMSVAVNVFFRSFENNAYAAGRDVYGNRDLGVYQNGRRDIAKIIEKIAAEPELGRAERINVIARILADEGFRRQVVKGGREIGEGNRVGEKEVLRILRSVEALPDDIGQFYLDRLAVEMEDFAKTCRRDEI
ncbi:hypothetical protein FKW77_007802 [Venturia effusa]|uniref:tRNA wybutosine-synthesizing protein 4 n=1 Tax=Venturia effusa TaxID=50376 RepID=A0A517LCN0_9PEZI|nr:hypothetical protein FKW77_007802 [Venturia effusa]